jgi:hypothetical protein
MSDLALTAGAFALGAVTESRPRLRLWPAAILSVAVVGAALLPKVFIPATPMAFRINLLGPQIGGGLFLAWWLFLSRAPWLEKLAAVGAVVNAAAFAMLFAHDREAMGFGLFLYGVPTLLSIWTIWLFVSQGASRGVRGVGLLLAIFASIDFYVLLRIDGIDGAFTPGFNWRWTKKPEEEFLASRAALKE